VHRIGLNDSFINQKVELTPYNLKRSTAHMRARGIVIKKSI